MTGAGAKGSALALPGNRLGRYDKDVEIFRNGQFVDGLLHNVVPGDSFCTKERPSLWFYCLTPIHRSHAMVRGMVDTENPTFSMYGLEVLQAKPTVERVVEQPKLPASKPAPRLTYDDVDDVDFRE